MIAGMSGSMQGRQLKSAEIKNMAVRKEMRGGAVCKARDLLYPTLPLVRQRAVSRNL